MSGLELSLTLNFVLIVILFGIAARPMMDDVVDGPRSFVSILLIVAGSWIFILLPISWHPVLRVALAFTIMAVSAGLFSDVPKWRASYLEKKQ